MLFLIVENMLWQIRRIGIFEKQGCITFASMLHSNLEQISLAFSFLPNAELRCEAVRMFFPCVFLFSFYSYEKNCFFLFLVTSVVKKILCSYFYLLPSVLKKRFDPVFI